MYAVTPPVARVERISPYGWRGGRFHHGIDLFAPWGTPVYAAADGVVHRSVESGTLGFNRYGHTVIVRHADRWMTLYAHLGGRSVTEGERVRRGQQVGVVGRSAGTVADPDATFRTSTPHVHFEAITAYPASAGGPNVEGAAVRSKDPKIWFRERGGDILGGPGRKTALGGALVVVAGVAALWWLWGRR